MPRERLRDLQLRRFREQATHAYERIGAEVLPDADRDRDAIRGELRKELKQATNLTFSIELVEYESLDRPELKADRLTDNRSTHV